MTFDASRFGPDLSIVDDLIGVLLRRKLTVLLTTIGVLIGTYLVLSYLTEQYESEARLIVRLGRENTEVPITVENGGVFASGVQEEEVNSYVKLLQSRLIVERVVDDVGLDAFDFSLPEPTSFFQRLKYSLKKGVRYAKKQVNELLITVDLKKRLTDREKVVKLVQGSLSVQREGKSNVIRVAIRLPSAELSSRVLESLLENYFKLHVGLHQSADMFALFDAESKRYHDELEVLQQRMIAIRQEWNLSAVDVQRSELLKRMNQLESASETDQVELARVTREREAMTAVLDSLPERLKTSETIEPNPSAQQLKEALIEKRLGRLDIGSRYNEQLPMVASIDEAIDAINQLIEAQDKTQAGEVTYVPHPMRLQLEKELRELDIRQTGLNASIAARTEQIASIDQQLHDLDQGENYLDLVGLEYSVLQKKYVDNATRREQARLDRQLDAGEISNVAVLSPPTVPSEPIFPRKLLIMGVGVFAGLILGCGLALTLSWTDDTIYCAADLRSSSSLPFLGEFRLTP